MDSSNLKSVYGGILVGLAKKEFEKTLEEMDIFIELQDTMGNLIIF